MKSKSAVVALLLVVGLMSLGASVSIAPAASAAGVCAQKAEYKKVKTGMTLSRVKRIFGGAPTMTAARDDDYSAIWKKCGTSPLGPGQFAGACIHFADGNVDHKTWTNMPEGYCVAADGGMRGTGPRKR